MKISTRFLALGIALAALTMGVSAPANAAASRADDGTDLGAFTIDSTINGYSQSLMETNETYLAFSDVFTVVTTPSYWQHANQQWRILEYNGGEYYRIVNAATGNALQATHETNGLPGGHALVASPGSYDSPYQRWSIIGTQATGFLIVNLVTSDELGSIDALANTQSTYLAFPNVHHAATTTNAADAGRTWSIPLFVPTAHPGASANPTVTGWATASRVAAPAVVSAQFAVSGLGRRASALAWTLFGPVAAHSGGCSTVDFAGAPIRATGSSVVRGDGPVYISPASVDARGCYSYVAQLAPTPSSQGVPVVGRQSLTFIAE